MGVIVIFMVLMAAIAFWWLSRQRLTAKPWLEVGIIGDAGRAVAESELGANVKLDVAAAIGCLALECLALAPGVHRERPACFSPHWIENA